MNRSSVMPDVPATDLKIHPPPKLPSTLRKLLLSLGFLLLLQPALPHYKAQYHVIIDTDGGIDDFRAICMMLASPQIEVIAITAVDGVLPPEVTAGKVYSLLQKFGHQGIPVGPGPAIPGKSKKLTMETGMAEKLTWGTHDKPWPPGMPPGAVSLILESIELEDMPIDIVAMGPMTNLATVLRADPETAGRVRQVYWYGAKADKIAFNYALDPASAKEVLASGFNICRVDADGGTLGSPGDFLGGLDTLSTRYAEAIADLYRSAPEGFTGHYMATHPGDDCIPLCMLYPEKFTVTGKSDPENSGNELPCTRAGEAKRSQAVADASTSLVPTILEVLDSDREDKSIVFSRFPTDPGLLEEDVAAIAQQVIERHGLKEWKIVALTNEFHEHLGIYSILGAKMGLRAREYFHVGIDELTILSCAGSQPPLSCMNDGLQVSTGATLGHGTIRLGEEELLPRAYFTFKKRVIMVTLRPEIREKIREDVSRGVAAYGLETPGYWDYIRELALQYWLDLSRFDIFEIAELPPGLE